MPSHSYLILFFSLLSEKELDLVGNHDWMDHTRNLNRAERVLEDMQFKCIM